MSKGGKRPGAGRPAGARNKATAEVKALALPYAKEAVGHLATLMKSAESEAARVAAIKEILDRAFGKAPQAHTGEDGEGPIRHAIEIRIVDPSEDNG
jgi:hypothetical protein